MSVSRAERDPHLEVLFKNSVLASSVFLHLLLISTLVSADPHFEHHHPQWILHRPPSA